MRRMLLAVSSLGAVLGSFALIFWYLLHPESWNWRSRGELLAEEASAPAEPAFIEARVVADPQQMVRNTANVARTSQSPGATRNFSEEPMPASCSLPETVTVTQRANAVIYTWRDERGVVNFTSEPPRIPTLAVRKIDYWTDPDYFDLAIEYRGADAIPAFRNDLEQDATGVYKVLARLVGENYLRKVDLNVVIYPDRGAYLRYAMSSTGRNMESTSGFYSPRSNEAVTYIQTQRDETLITARHEATHVIVRGILGLVPPWLNEGLAEYFSRLDIFAQVERVAADESALQLARTSLRSGYPRRLRDLLSLSPDDWRGANQSAHYAVAGGLMFFMMGNDERRRVLSALLRTTAAQYCRQLDTNALLDEFYPGGIGALESDFASWLQDASPKAPHDF
jgi:hypothetical protein